MGISIIGPTPAAVPDRTTIPGTQPKRVPRAKDEEENAWPSGDAHAEAGAPGFDGLPGEVGGNNVDGGATPSHLNFIIQGSFLGVFEVNVLGGNGGLGGKGGTGGGGGEGQDGGQKGDEGDDAPGGIGGKGGTGGNGGNGGNGGDANSFDLYIPNANDVITLNTQITFSGGFLGRGGEGGAAGPSGLGGLTGSRDGGERAQTGPPGDIGSPGPDGAHNGNTGQLNIYIGHP
jgi:hypothetical protein